MPGLVQDRPRCRRAATADASWRADRLTASVRPSAGGCQATACSQASRSTRRPMSTIIPLSSAHGMNSAGASRPRVGCSQRTSASTPVIVAAREVDHRLVVDDELVVLERVLEVHEQLEAVVRRVDHLRHERHRLALALRLRLVHRDVGVPDQVLDADVEPLAMPMLADTEIVRPAISKGARSTSLRRSASSSADAVRGARVRRARRTRRRPAGRSVVLAQRVAHALRRRRRAAGRRRRGPCRR